MRLPPRGERCAWPTLRPRKRPRSPRPAAGVSWPLAGPLLERISAREAFDAAGRERCLLAEAEVRDGLVAAPLLTPELIATLRDCRQRGVIVAVTAEEREGDVGLAEFRGILGSILEPSPRSARGSTRDFALTIGGGWGR
jgi:hypothetical protein